MANIAHWFHFSLTEMDQMGLVELMDWQARAARFAEATNGN